MLSPAQQLNPKTSYDFFYRSQLIFSPAQPGQQIYAVLEGEIALYNGNYRVYTLPAGHCLAEVTLRQSGWVAVAHTNCRLVALDAATYAALANLSPDFVLGAIRPPRYSAGESLPVQVCRPSVLLARRHQRPRRNRETAQVFEAPRMTRGKFIVNSLLALLLAWLSFAPAYAAAPPVCYPNTPLAELWLENSPLADQAYGDHRLDFDGDGKTDVFSTIPEEGRHRWRFSVGARQPWQNLGHSVVEPANLRFGNFDDDDQTDLFSIGPNHRWRFSAGGTTIWQPLFQDPDQTPLNELRFGDFNGDGKTDVFRQDAENKWFYWSGTRPDQWHALNVRHMDTPLAELRFGDFDGDSRTDLFSIGPNHQWWVSLAGATSWQPLFQDPAQIPLNELRFGDFEGDGQTDVFWQDAENKWFYSSGAKADWQLLNSADMETPLAGLRVGDFNGDGLTDVLSEAPGGKWRVSWGGTTAWQIIFATVEVDGGRLTCLTGASEANRSNGAPAISADGSKIVFSSDSDFKGEGDIARGQFEIWLYDVARGGLTRLTDSGSGGHSLKPAISADGHKVAFQSNADFGGDTLNRQEEIWLYDVTSGELIRLTDSGSGGHNISPTISANGGKIAFASLADFKDGIENDQYEIWLYNADADDFTRLTDSGPNRDNFLPAISADGRKIVFESDAEFGGEVVPDNQIEIWLYDVAGGTLSRITNSGTGRISSTPAISADGGKIVFESDAEFGGEAVPDNQIEIWLYDVAGEEFTRVTSSSGPERENLAPAISADGSKIIFGSDADFLELGTPPGQNEIWSYDITRKELTPITNSGPGEASILPAINTDGSKIAFVSSADFLGLGTPSRQTEIWLFEAGPTSPSPNPTPTPNPTPAPQPNPAGTFTVYLPLVVK